MIVGNGNQFTLGLAPNSPDGYLIRINIYYYVFQAQNNFSTFFPLNDNGLRNFKTVLGMVVLHEMLHLEGHKHPKIPGPYDPTNAYYRSFPEVAEQAYFRLRADTFPPDSATGNPIDTPAGFNLVPGESIIKCGTIG